jgi:hypothetical protein
MNLVATKILHQVSWLEQGEVGTCAATEASCSFDMQAVKKVQNIFHATFLLRAEPSS